MQDLELSYPYRKYPGIQSEYEYVNLYNLELKRLDNFLINFIIDDSKLIIFIIGSLIDDDKSFNSEYRQHLPDFVLDKIGTLEIHIIVVNPKPVETPKFILKTKNLNWVKISENQSYHSSENKLFYYYFTCSIPAFVRDDYHEKYRMQGTNKFVYSRYARIRHFFDINRSTNTIAIKDSVPDQYRLSILKTAPSENDIRYVEYFYDFTFKNFINRLIKSNSKIIFLNYAVFYAETQRLPFSNPNYFITVLKEKIIDNYNIPLLHYHFKKNPHTNDYYQYYYYHSNDHVISISYFDNQANTEIYGKYSMNFTEKFPGIEFVRISDKKRRYHIDYKGKSKKDKIKFYSSGDKIIVDGHRFVIEEVPGDGDCMFNAILRQTIERDKDLKKDEDKGESKYDEEDQLKLMVKNLRRLVANKIRSFDFDSDSMVTLLGQIRQERYFDRIIREINDPDEVNRKLIDYYTYFLERGPYNNEAEQRRRSLRLPLEIFYAGETELEIIADALNLTIKVIRTYSNGNNFITTFGAGPQTIYLMHQGLHFNIAKKIYNYTL